MKSTSIAVDFANSVFQIHDFDDHIQALTREN